VKNNLSAISFRLALADWQQAFGRELPWTQTKDPYKIWLSEIILQQTRVAQGLPYYERIIARYPTVDDLAETEDVLFFKEWEGLGYYSRARNMLQTARWISRENKGRFPNTYEQLLKLKGVGPYTAAAIASFAFDLPHAAVDGNVIRVLSRLLGIYEAVDSPSVHQFIQDTASYLIDPIAPGRFNQAMMDFGSLVCTPKNPTCNLCPFSNQCIAHKESAQALIPRKSSKIARKKRFFLYYWCSDGDKILVKERKLADVWRNLWEFPGQELDEHTFNSTKQKKEGNNKEEIVFEGKQMLTHQEIHVRIFRKEHTTDYFPEDCVAVSEDVFKALPMPKILRRFADSYMEGLFLH
jgi:A/G-specific adenine glycosylase